jgi:hypothetical protein
MVGLIRPDDHPDTKTVAAIAAVARDTLAGAVARVGMWPPLDR